MVRQRRRLEAQRRKRNRRLFMFWGLVGLIAVAVVAGFLGMQQGSQSEIKAPHTQEEIQKFWEEHLSTLVMKQLAGTAHPNEIVNLIIQERYRLINERYNNPRFALEGNENYGPKDALMGARVEPGVVAIGFMVPALMDSFHGIGADRNPAQRSVFENGLVMGYIHELDHLAYDLIESPRTLEERVTSESITWAKTVQSMELLVSKGAFQLHPSDQKYYSVWLESKRRKDSSMWVSFIREMYRHTVP